MFDIDIQIDRPVANVFDYLKDMEACSRWYEAVRSVDRVSSGSTGQGSRFQFKRKIGGKAIDNTVEVTEFHEPDLLTIASVNGPTPFSYRYRLSPSDGGTRLHLTGSISGEGLTGAIALLAPLANTLFKKGMRTNLETLKRLIERSAQ
ncbi:SRPBCC family protein [Bradyrhizobium sp. Pear76]|uniref:SRPBCC family protein n=1 Tax=Bradyrhizobium oropedii TaxID=1571201 RepID=UPI001E2D5233|nr:SRPBCC family protein [Bradyrhizobium oropedii]MCC8967746.1 SRPBCC family protein [Bradyrhizobium oropedii]